MLLVPSGDAAPQGFSRNDPIVLTGDTLEELRAFHALAYSSLGQQMPPCVHDGDLERMIAAGLFSHKYGMYSFRDFALRTIRDMGPKFAWDLLRMQTVHKLLRLTWLCGPERYNDPVTDEFAIRGFARTSWLARLPKHPSAKNFSAKLASAEQYDCRPLLGALYHLYLCHITASAPGSGSPPAPSATVFPDAGLAARHRTNLLAGYWSLTQCWSRFAQHVPKIVRLKACSRATHDPVCIDAWALAWAKAAAHADVRALQPVDVLRRLAAFRTVLGRLCGSRCMAAMLEDADPVAKYRRQLEDTLADHFLGPLVLPPADADTSSSLDLPPW
ncbi:hypothetical protein B0H15DRAFT_577665 [Mycena belliarum]|uniref:Uncharacterized protein n=1 Tax=Mycena belliarum TaxID=1033014 RepID=A0AAD6XG47_9AGAR|nr:hypothetical protein B0H15DRAFT_577665 [Mycena belliae]